MDQLGNLPPAAPISLGAVLAVIFAARFLGLWQGENARPPHPAAAEVAAVIIDPTALMRATEEVSKLTQVLKDICEIGERMARRSETMAIELDRIREELRIQREVERRR